MSAMRTLHFGKRQVRDSSHLMRPSTALIRVNESLASNWSSHTRKAVSSLSHLQQGANSSNKIQFMMLYSHGMVRVSVSEMTFIPLLILDQLIPGYLKER